MNNFGLGLIISCTDNATSGLRSVTGAFNDLNNTTAAFSQANGVEAALMQISVAAGIVGDELYQVGKGITSMFAGVIQRVTETGTTILTAKTQLGTLYGSMEAGEAQLEKIKDYAAKSIFNFEDLIPSVIMLKANGIEAFDQIATSAYEASNGMEGTAQTLMDYASDLAAYNPQMRNAYGTGVQAAMGALNEYIAEGNAMLLKRGASIDINSLLGEDTGGSIEERSRQVADLIEQVGMVGTTANLASTPMQRLSSVEDTLFNLTAEISNSGVYDKYSELIAKLTDYILSIPKDELKSIANTIGEALVEILDLLDPVVDGVIKLADAVRNFVKTNPELTKTIIKFTALAGVATLLTGAGLKLVSALGMLRFSISMLFKGSGALSGGAKLLGIFKSLFLYILPLVALSALLKAAWDRDFLGMRDNVTNALKTIWETFKLVADAFTDNTLSAENFQKAKDMGILPLIEGILQLKYHWQFFVEGFKKGLDAFFESLKNVLTQLGILDVDVSSFGELIVALIDKMTAPGMTDTWEKVGYFIGKAVGWIAVAIVMLPVVIKSVKIILGTIKTVVTVCKTIWNTVKFIWNVLKTVWNVVKTIYNKLKFIVNIVKSIPWGTILSGIKNIGTILKTIFGGFKTAIVWILTGIGSIVIAILGAMGIVVTLPAWLVGLIVVAIVAVIALIVVFWDEIKAFFINLGNAIADVFTKAWEWFSNLPWVQAVIGFVQGIIQAVKDAVNKVIQALMPIITPVVDIIKTIISTIISIAQSVWSIIQSIAGMVWTVISTIISIIATAAQAIWSVIQTIWGVIKQVAMSIWGLISSVANLIKNIFYAIYQVIRAIVLAVIAVFKILWDGISAGLSFIYNLFATIFGWIYENIISPVVEAISTAFSWVYNNVISPVIEAIGTAFTWLKDNVITPVCNFFKRVFETIAEKAEWLKDKFVTVFGAIKDFITGAIEKARDIVMPIIEAIGGAIQGIIDGVSWVVDHISGFFEGVGDFFGGIGDGISDFIGLDTGGYVKETGVACLHPNEVVVNDVLTKRLGTFLSDYNSAKTTSSPLIKQNIVATDDYTDEDNPINPTPVVVPPPTGDDDNSDSPMRSLVNNTTNNNTYDESSSNDNRTQDNSVTFESGSIVFNIDKDTDLSDEGLDALADKLMKKMSRKMQLRNMQTRV